MSWPNPGIHRGVSPADYFALTEIDGQLVRSNSMLAEFDRDPSLFRSGHRKVATKAIRRGSLFDCLLTSPRRFDDEFVASPYAKFQSNEAKEWKKAQTKTIVTEKEMESAVATIKAIQSDRRWQEMTEGDCAFQVPIRADFDGGKFKGLVDLLPDKDGPYGDAIVDVKRLTRMDDLNDVLRACRNLELNRQGGLYRTILRYITGERRDRYILFIVPQAGPVTPCVLELGSMMLDNGAQEILRMHRRLRDCEETGHWPGRFDGVKKVEQADSDWPWKEEDEAELEEALPQ
jgi:hypothetical protein